MRMSMKKITHSESGPQRELTRCTLNRIVDPEQAHSRLVRALQALHLAHRRLEDARLDVIPHLAVQQVQPVVHQPLLRVTRGRVLRRVVESAQFRDELRRVLGRIHREDLRDHE